ncbi:acyl-CoA dehydrogenase, C-terminal domain protein [Mycobacterium xenopi 4042]|uniref:Acyl-CoA dehydrogenase, C-terminal domain protein n=1 Tax=Mycobacterium xenopi 4042 TaxID=1299334 RepID=X8BLJ7_MYCXE|nr:acyl-CoA dehydrogenase, C-terminal domain protein [Mycobacterium xenopi 4042]
MAAPGCRHYLADMATKLTAARQLTRYAAERYDSGERADMEAGMANCSPPRWRWRSH